MDMIRILLVDDQKDFVDGLARIIEKHFPCKCLKAYSGQEALEILAQKKVQVLITDLRMPEINGIELVKRAQKNNSELTSIVLTAYGNIESAVEAVKSGAYDFLTKPVSLEQLNLVLNKVIEKVKIIAENERLKQALLQTKFGQDLIGQSPVMQRLKEKIAAMGSNDFTVLIRGESGTGKELVARKIHQLSRRKDKPFVCVNCPAIPGNLLESELFGHKKGAFTGADQSRLGLFQRANQGTILLDEIGDIDLDLQAKLLRVLQEKEIRPVGSDKTIHCDVRILATTNQPLEEKIKQGLFREDLFYRLNVLEVRVPPLRERKEDIPLLAHYFVGQTCLELGLQSKEVEPDVLAYLSARDWPGNVRELQNFVRRLVVFSKEVITLKSIDLVEVENNFDLKEKIIPYKEYKKQVINSFTKNYFQKILQKTKGNISEAARLSGIERVSLQKIIKRLNLDVTQFR